MNGVWLDARSEDVLEVDNPATGEVVGTVPAFGREETRAAIEAAGAAWTGWRSRPAKDRAGLMRRWFELMMAYRDDLAVLMTSEQGKPLAEARGEVCLRGVVRRVVRRGGQARLRRRHLSSSGPASGSWC